MTKYEYADKFSACYQQPSVYEYLYKEGWRLISVVSDVTEYSTVGTTTYFHYIFEREIQQEVHYNE